MFDLSDIDPDPELSRGLLYSATGIIVFPLMYWGCCHIARFLLPHAKKVTIMTFGNLFVSMIQALVSSTVGLMIVYSCRGDVLLDRHPFANVYAWLAMSYFLYDTIGMYLVHCAKFESLIKHNSFYNRVKHFILYRGNIMMVGHHTVVLLFGFPISVRFRGRLGDFVIGCFYLTELSTPFVHFRTILSELKRKDTLLYTLNGIIMIHVFFCCRILLFPYMYWMFGARNGQSILEVMFSIPVHCNLGCFLLLFPQVYWMALMIRGALRHFSKTKKVL